MTFEWLSLLCTCGRCAEAQALLCTQWRAQQRPPCACQHTFMVCSMQRGRSEADTAMRGGTCAA